ncbi:hypothetical protein DHEL01_v201747 [Diaporthe helianthi]|uniref:Uncharacterized protein n=1 Tax=Diaporthe helianthi TaxID=158607 RepID=A0A2P5IBG1_DIAHE|nr:hypothetical protein DHEL01_v201747 [Diaporthe helianthi]
MTIRRNMETWIAHGRPTSFSQRRTDFASATPWFRGVQTGFWSTNAGDPRNTRDADAKEEKYCTGLYIAGCPPAGRYIDAETVISSINGPDNNLKLIADRERETRHSLRSRIPIGIAVSKDAAKPDEHGVQTFPCAIPEGLECVALGWYMITHMWVKPGKNAKGHDTDVWMARLEKIDLAERSWWSDVKWADQPQPSMEDRDFTTKAAKETCQTCQESSVRLFEPQFVCLNKQCRDWFLVNGEHADANPANLVYHHRFLMERFDRFDQSSHDAARGFWDFYPNLYPPPDQFFAKNYPDGQGPQVSVTPQNLAARNEALLTGFSCPQCGLTNSRVDYHRWHCRNTDCRDAEGNVKPFSYHAPPPRVTPEFLEAERKTVKEKAEKPFDKLFGYLGTEELGSHILYVFDFGGGCRMTILRPQVGSVAREMSDALFQRVQEDGAAGRLGLSRRTITANGGAGLTNHFVENFGERYYLPFALGDNPMAQAPEVVRDALDLANVYTWEYFGPGKNNEWRFNELYIAAYQSRKMHMNFHDDGEKKLGPIIGTWTLGGHATFKLCIKPQYDYGRKAKDSAWMKPQEDGTIDPVPAGCTEEDFRKELKARFERGEIDGEQWTAQLQEHMDQHMADPNSKKTYAKRSLVSFNVEHGDVVVMWGPNTQRFMEHAVECKSPMRFAITLRRVTENMATDQQWEVLNKRLVTDRAFTPSWAVEVEDGVNGEAEDEVRPGGKRVKRSKAEKVVKKVKVETGNDEVQGEDEDENEAKPAEAKPTKARVMRSMSKKGKEKE